MSDIYVVSRCSDGWQVEIGGLPYCKCVTQGRAEIIASKLNGYIDACILSELQRKANAYPKLVEALKESQIYVTHMDYNLALNIQIEALLTELKEIK